MGQISPEEYATEVLALCDLPGVFLAVRDRQRLKALRHLPALGSLLLNVDATDAEIAAALQGKRLEHLDLIGNRWITGLSCLLPTAASLEHLGVSDCPGIRDLKTLGEFSALESLRLDVGPLPTAHEDIAGILPAGLKMLVLRGLDVDRLSHVPPHRAVEELVLSSRRPLALDNLDAWPSLTALEISALSDPDAAFTALRNRPRVTSLTFGAFPWRITHDGAPPLPSVESLTVRFPRNSEDLARLRALFPRLTELELDTSEHNGEVDLTPLHDWPGLTVSITHEVGIVLIGAEELGDRLY